MLVPRLMLREAHPGQGRLGEDDGDVVAVIDAALDGQAGVGGRHDPVGLGRRGQLVGPRDIAAGPDVGSRGAQPAVRDDARVLNATPARSSASPARSGVRPTATSTRSASISSRPPPCLSTARAALPCRPATSTAFVPVSRRMPSARSTSSRRPTSSPSAIGSRRGAISTTVVSTPSRPKAEAYSRPSTPPPRMRSDRGRVSNR